MLLLLGLYAQAAEKPNVVFLLSDDQGWMDYEFMGHPHVQTPHLDTLAAEGLLYERGYVTAPLCRPSLAGLMTGRIQNEFGLPHNGSDAGSDGHVIVDGLKLIKNNSGRNPRIKAIR